MKLKQSSVGCRRLAILGLMLSTIASAGITKAQETSSEKSWWKGNLHTHSLWSDGDDFPEMIVDWYASRDYNFLALTDHNILSEGIRWMPMKTILQRAEPDVLDKYLKRFGPDWVEQQGQPGTDEHKIRLKPLDEFGPLFQQAGKFLLMPGEEISDRAEGKPVHMNATNIRDVIQPVGGATVREAMQNNLRLVIEQEKETGRPILPHLNHPNFGYAITAEDLANVVQEQFFEVYNGHPGVNQLGDKDHPSVEKIWDIANTIRLAQLEAEPLLGIATDDSHEYHGRPGSRPGRGWVMVRSAFLTPEHLIAAMRMGDFYASSGVALRDISYDRESKKLAVHIDAKPGVSYQTTFIGTPKPSAGTEVTAEMIGTTLATVEGETATYQLTGKELYVRAVVTSSEPHPDASYKDQTTQAWTQPVGWR